MKAVPKGIFTDGFLCIRDYFMALDEEKLLIAKMNDLYSKCDKYASAVFSAFLDSSSQVTVKEKCFNHAGYNIELFGGFDDAERKIFGVFPEWSEIDHSEYPIMALNVRCKGEAELTHRDYLGSVLSLGIDRSKIGDILVDGGNAIIFAMEDIASYIQNNISKIGRCGVEITAKNIDEIVLPERKFQTIEAVAGSERIDAVLSSALNLSRSNSVKLIEADKVQINHRPCQSVSHKLSVGDLISVRGFGRFILDGIGNETRKGRLHITLKKYI